MRNINVVTWLWKRLRNLELPCLFLPPYFPNLNIIERLWKFTKKQILYGKYYDSAEKFHVSIRFFFEQINYKNQAGIESLLTLNFLLFEDYINSQYNGIIGSVTPAEQLFIRLLVAHFLAKLKLC